MALERIRLICLIGLAACFAVSWAAPSAFAQKAKKDQAKKPAATQTKEKKETADKDTGPKFMGQPIKPMEGTYVVTKDVNVRAKPMTKGKRIGSLKRGQRVAAVGRAAKTASWLAVMQDGKEKGFVYAPMLVPLIDGILTEDLRGETKTAGGAKARATCEYAIRFEGKSQMDEEYFLSSDYTVYFRCKGGGKKLLFDGPMFLTEAPFKLGTKPEYQITLDLLSISEEYDKVFSTTSLYNLGDGSVTFDGGSIKKLAKKPDPKMRVVEDVKGALKAAVELAVLSWTDKVWQQLANPNGKAGNGTKKSKN